MPLYLCNARKGAIEPAARAAIAVDITRIHCDITGAPPAFVHAFFFEEAPHPALEGRMAMLVGSIRGGRTARQKARLADEMIAAIQSRTGLAGDDIGARLSETPASWVMEGGDVLPEPGAEAAWLVAHEARRAAGNAG